MSFRNPRWRSRVAPGAGIRVAVCSALLGVVAVSSLDCSAAFAAASGGDGAGGSVTVGAGSGTSSGGTPGSTGGGGQGGGSAPSICTYTLLTLNDQSQPPGGPTPGAWYSVTCIDPSTGAQTTQTEWIPDQVSTGSPSVDPYSLALQAERSMVLPRPQIGANPSGTSVVNLATWLWIDPGLWHVYHVTASAGPVSATASAVPTAVTWSMGDGDSITCAGPGVPYEPAPPTDNRTTDCSYRYAVSSAGQPSPDGNPDEGAFLVRATVSWSVSWSAQGAAGGGSLPPLSTSSTALLRVEQVESLDTALITRGSSDYANRTRGSNSRYADRVVEPSGSRCT
jgi:hypothetical protein